LTVRPSGRPGQCYRLATLIEITLIEITLQGAPMDRTRIAVLHPGDMGSAIGGDLTGQGLRVFWASGGRSEATRRRATADGLIDRLSVGACLDAADIVLSVCPPHAALDQAREVAGHRFHGLYVDANAISPAASREAQALIEGAGGGYVDGGIVGPPPRKAGSTRLFLSGARSAEVARLFGKTRLEAIVLEGGVGAASALKTCYAAWTKGTWALLGAIRSLAQHEGVDAALLAEWERSQPGLPARSEAVALQARKAWRWVGEMHEIASAFEDAGLPGDFHRGAAALY
jgi:3-hydroxyisobutyrate dehydrogenase-like beta-hydroxyacid dehydrogenase